MSKQFITLKHLYLFVFKLLQIKIFIYRITLGEPSGGASLGENVECRITVTNDILPGKIDFASPKVSAKQTDEKLKIKLVRSQYLEGKTENLQLTT